jgi:hypothetical protein
MSRIKRMSPALVISILALIAALVVPALAQVATTALTKKEKRVVRKIAKGQANKQITRRASGLAVASARSAGNADKLDGQDASGFTPADEVHSPSRVVLNDPTPGDLDSAQADLFTAGPFSIFGRCIENAAGIGEDVASLFVLGPENSSYSIVGSDGPPINQPALTGQLIASIQAAGNQVRSAHLVAVASNGQVVTLSGSVEVGDPAGDCVFGVTAIGP